MMIKRRIYHEKQNQKVIGLGLAATMTCTLLAGCSNTASGGDTADTPETEAGNGRLLPGRSKWKHRFYSEEHL